MRENVPFLTDLYCLAVTLVSGGNESFPIVSWHTPSAPKVFLRKATKRAQTQRTITMRNFLPYKHGVASSWIEYLYQGL
ncbi:hypothetical protein DSTSK_19100 [Desulforhabdus sp. TSK]|nr:hypothetical protein DSTSK_19100 [Desulforhabdus sp. TSK]